MNPRGVLVREVEALFSNVLILKPEEAEQEEESEREEATSEELTYIEDSSNPVGGHTKEYESKPKKPESKPEITFIKELNCAYVRVESSKNF